MSTDVSVHADAHARQRLPLLDKTGISAVIAAALWTTAVVLSLAWIQHNRHIPSIRALNFPLLITAVVVLHVYWFVNVVSYPFMGSLSCNVEFWLLSVNLPVGVTFYQFHNFRFLDVCLGRERWDRNDARRPRGSGCAYGLVLWLIYVAFAKPKADELDTFWGSTLWFVPSVMVLEAAALYYPMKDIISSARVIHHVPRRPATPVARPSHPDPPPSSFRDDFEAMLGGDMNSLLTFVITKDYSGENILFLHHVKTWKANWARLSQNHISRESLHRHMFSLAVEIYATYVSLHTANFPINIPDRIYSAFENMFSEATQLTRSTEANSTIVPFDSASEITLVEGGQPSIPLQTLSHGSRGAATIGRRPLADVPRPPLVRPQPSDMMVERYVEVLLGDLKKMSNEPAVLPEDVTIPEGFDENVFDEAERSVKTLVLRDTWPKFLRHQGAQDVAQAV
ncbi:hypothetical protein PRK78_006975 [Emydomyces testavorans]|uniref:RGS domain-containing protein n=1 Tax=Emydomyces testavorans TaxID=2070801 RepID=A0AAF0DMC1_9EURO|nr:hypothetical protein PRK78_006975 [Emydomyces testavorans]